MLNFCDFIQVFLFTTNHHLKLVKISRTTKLRLAYYAIVLEGLCFFFGEKDFEIFCKI